MQVDILLHSRAIYIHFQLPFSIFLQQGNDGRILLLIISILALLKKIEWVEKKILQLHSYVSYLREIYEPKWLSILIRVTQK